MTSQVFVVCAILIAYAEAGFLLGGGGGGGHGYSGGGGGYGTLNYISTIL